MGLAILGDDPLGHLPKRASVGHTYASFLSVAHTNPCINYFQVVFRDLAKVLRDEKV